MASPPPLSDIRVLEFAGLAPGPFAGMLLADYGATVLRIDRPTAVHTPTQDQLTRRKSSITVDIKSPAGIELIKKLIPSVDVVIDPFRPGVLEKLGLAPDEMLRINSRLIVARMTGFRRDGKYKDMAGHDINYIAVSGVLSMLGRKGEKPYAPGNILGDFAGGGLMCFVGILLALLVREVRGGRGQVVEANMVDGSAFLATMPRLAQKTPTWSGERGTNLLDSGCPFYETYETKDEKYMAVGALEPQFFAAFLEGLGISPESLPGPPNDRSAWPALRELFGKTFKSKTRKEWEAIFDGKDACCTPVLTNSELEAMGYDQRPAVTLRGSPGRAIRDAKDGAGNEDGQGGEKDVTRGQGLGVEGEGWRTNPLKAGEGGEETLERWTGWKKGRHIEFVNGGMIWKNAARL